ncbi:hypothetical protein EIP91_011471 [Steccherinum ochraceum]|uniref:Protein kinase domain-containing protein n=1 Tax=Steccherinum ochraceum TaxID=92696 RepID=A0A4R0QZP2_9APHY|nr:hypothetical protein EIP91_011471 [Steccherinum ochraceum]
MSALVGPALDIAQTAADLTGVPYLSTAIGLVQSIKGNCDKIQVHRSDCRILADKSSLLIQTFADQASQLHESKLREHADAVEGVLVKVYGRTTKWANYSSFHVFFRDSKIGEGIKQCTSDIETALAAFHVNAVVVMDRKTEDIKQTLLSNQVGIDQILYILRSDDALRVVADLQRSGEPVATRVMDAGKQNLQLLREQHGDPSRPVESEAYLETERGMSKLFALTGIPPTVRTLNGEVTRRDDLPYVGGTYSDIWIGFWLGNHKVALKTMRGVVIPRDKAQKKFEAEIKVWARLSHPNVLPFLGIVTDLGHFTHMVSPWQENGNVIEYIKTYERADRLHLLAGAAEGLAYLHSQNVTHGNVRCANILVAIGGEAVICDFGMSRIREETSAQSATATLTAQGSARWMSPELLDASVSSSDPHCDVYSYGMCMLECFTLAQPFMDIKNELRVISMMSKGHLLPKRPDTGAALEWITDEVWAFVLECLRHEPAKRPDMKTVALRTKQLEISRRTSMSSSPKPTPSTFQMPSPEVQSPLQMPTPSFSPSPATPGTPAEVPLRAA